MVCKGLTIERHYVWKSFGIMFAVIHLPYRLNEWVSQKTVKKDKSS